MCAGYAMKRRWLTLATVLAAAASASLPAQTLPSAFKACMQITADAQRLACFDRESATLAASAAAVAHAAAGTPAATAGGTAAAVVPGTAVGGAAVGGAAAAGSAIAVPLTPEQKLGLSPERVRQIEGKQGVPQVESAKARVTQVSTNASGRGVYMLDNGQTWRQTENKSSFTLQTGDVATITTGVFGSFWLSTGTRNQTRVERVR